jgi:hypothetical protein
MTSEANEILLAEDDRADDELAVLSQRSRATHAPGRA